MELLEGELIEQIEEIDEGWWSGVGDNGRKTGLFPGDFRFIAGRFWVMLMTLLFLQRIMWSLLNHRKKLRRNLNLNRSLNLRLRLLLLHLLYVFSQLVEW